MKITSVLILAAALHCAAAGHSQNISISQKGARLETIFKEIERQSDYEFFYRLAILPSETRLDVDLKNVSIQEALDKVLKDLPLSYEIVRKTVVIKAKPAIPKAEAVIVNEPPPPIDVTGRLINENGEPVAGASVKVKGTNNGTTTDENGNFSLKGVRPDDVLVFSGTNIEGFETKVNNRSLLELTAKIKVSSLNEVVVNKGYYTEKMRNTVGNVSSIKSADIEKQPIQNPLLALQGRVPGLEITQLTGMPGGAVTVRIQGQNSIRLTGLDPLVIVDGVPFPTSLLSSTYEGIVQGGSPLNYINPNDIESIDILKDADATAIYGSRAANGAILITTKKGKAGRTKVDVNLQQGWSKVARKVDMMNTHQYLDMRYEALKNDGITLATLNQTNNYDLTVWDTTRYTDWQKELIGGTALFTNLNTSVSGGTSSLQYLISGTFRRQTNVFPGDYDDKSGNLHSSITANSNDQRFKVQLSSTFLYDKNRLPGIDLTQFAVLFAPDAPALYNSNGTLNWQQNSAGTSTFLNPLAKIFGQELENTTKNMVHNLILSYQILPGLKIKNSVGYTSTQSSGVLITRLESERPERIASGQAQRSTNNFERDMNSWVFEPQIQYSVKMGKGNIEALVGGSILQNHAKVITITGSGYSTDLLMQSLNAATSVSVSSSSSESKFNGLFGRLNYVWDKKYIIDLTARRDGSSKFGDANKLHDFGSAAVGWIFSEEKWINESFRFLSFGKLKGSYGTTGNDQIGDFGHLSTYSISNPQILYQGSIGLQPARIPNPHLQWEETRKLQTGIDLGFINDRILIGATYVRNRSSNQLVSYTLPSTTGFTSVTQNLPALIQNSNWEFTVSTINLERKNFKWSFNANLTIPRNKLISFPGIEKTPYANATTRVIVGQALDVNKVYKYIGVDPATGKYQVFTANGNVTTSPSSATDKIALVSNMTKYYGGLQNNINYKGFELDIHFQFVRQQGLPEMYYYGGNGAIQPGGFNASGLINQPISVLDRWKKPGDEANIAKFTTQGGSTGVIIWPTQSNVWYNSYDASFIRLKNVSLSWQIPSSRIQRAKLQNVKLYLQGQNLATITKYRGLDPETKSSVTLPPLRTMTVGVQIGL